MSWKNIVGHDAAVQLLKGQILKNRIPHASIFVGARGIGKGTLALEFAKALQCPSADPFGSCDLCDTCRRIEKESFPDVLWITPELESGQIAIDQIRRLSGWLSLTPLEGRCKVGIIDEADAFTEQAAHACLKLLEEPPERSLLLLVTAAIHRLPMTLVSRCHRIRCWPQGIAQVAHFLREKENLDSRMGTLLATLSGGRLGLALTLHRQQRLKAKNAVLDGLLAAYRRGDLEIGLGKSSRPELEEALEWFAGWWRDLLVLELGGDTSWLIHQDRLEDLNPPSSVADRRWMGELIERIERTYWVQEAIQRNVSPRIALSVLLTV